MSGLLAKIMENRRRELEEAKAAVSPEAAKAAAEEAAREAPARGFAVALRKPGASFVAELKKASPVKGLLRADFNPAAIAARYEEAGAAAISVLTEKTHFMGSLENLPAARRACSLPLLRKDFIFDPYQVCEARAAGADALLLIVAALEVSELADLMALAHSLGMDALVEVHDEAELETASGLPCDVIGVNNRNLKTGEVDIATSVRLAPMFAAGTCKISESGIKSRADVVRLEAAGYDGFLVGETLVTRPDPGEALLELSGVSGERRAI
ncbi:MAG: Indole-3-glycerol phosphate synthase [bacterium ADurb.Bin236]|nr:MAG: Indole-3-glycerol phosphate synthase [bacterium ADurb.Bin236]HPN93916.1 indole-3-glycerol phosphate synthase TrpC [bacterium]